MTKNVAASGIAVLYVDKNAFDLVVCDFCFFLPRHDRRDVGPHVFGHRVGAFGEQLFQGIVNLAAEMCRCGYLRFACGHNALNKILSGLFAVGRAFKRGGGDLGRLPIH